MGKVMGLWYYVGRLPIMSQMGNKPLPLLHFLTMHDIITWTMIFPQERWDLREKQKKDQPRYGRQALHYAPFLFHPGRPGSD
jgi:hypothetical protein